MMAVMLTQQLFRCPAFQYEPRNSILQQTPVTLRLRVFSNRGSVLRLQKELTRSVKGEDREPPSSSDELGWQLNTSASLSLEQSSSEMCSVLSLTDPQILKKPGLRACCSQVNKCGRRLLEPVGGKQSPALDITEQELTGRESWQQTQRICWTLSQEITREQQGHAANTSSSWRKNQIRADSGQRISALGTEF